MLSHEPCFGVKMKTNLPGIVARNCCTFLLVCTGMIIKDYLNGIALRISFVKDFQEIDEIIAFMSITYKGIASPVKRSMARQKGDGAKTLVFIITFDCSMIAIWR